MTPTDWVANARTWIGTPYVHQASCKGAGSDCLGLVRGLWREAYGAEPCKVPPYSQDWSEPAHVEILWQNARDFLVEKPLAELCQGDVLLFRMRATSIAKHLGVFAQRNGQETFIHAYNGHGVVESALSAGWRRRLVACFSFPEGAS